LHKLSKSLVFILSFLFSIVKIRSYDLFIYLKVAEIEDFFKTLKINYFSFSHPQYEYINYSKLFSELSHFIYSLFGFNGLIFLQALTVAISLTILFSLKRRKDNIFLVFFVLLLSIFTIRYRLLFRPHNMTYLFFTVNIYLSLTKPKNYLLFLFINQILWVNTHNGFILGLVNPILLYPLFKFEKKNVEIFKILTVICLGSLLNQNFHRPFIEAFNPFFGERKDIFNIIKIYEWQAPDLYLYFSFYGILIFVSLLIILKEKRIAVLPIYLFYLTLSLKFVRFIDFFALTAFLTTIINFEKDWGINKKNSLVLIPLLIITLIICIKDYYKNFLIPSGLGLAKYFYPVDGINFLKINNIHGKIFNSYPYGGYIIYELFPASKPIIDGRLCYPLDFIKLYADSLEDPLAFRKITEQYRPEIFLLDYEHPNILNFLYLLKERYALVYFDDTSIIFLERLDKYSHIIKTYEYHYVAPQYIAGYGEGDLKDLKGIIEDLKRNLKETNSTRSKVMLGNILKNVGNIEEAKLLYTLVINNEYPIGKAEAYNNVGIILLEQEKVKEAINAFKKAMKYSVDFIEPHINLALIYKENKSYILAYYHYEIANYLLKKRGLHNNLKLLEGMDGLKKLAFKSLVEYIVIFFCFAGVLFLLVFRKCNILKKLAIMLKFSK
jgi:tetratricopeptide (TPR) repeat protein